MRTSSDARSQWRYGRAGSLGGAADDEQDSVRSSGSVMSDDGYGDDERDGGSAASWRSKQQRQSRATHVRVGTGKRGQRDGDALRATLNRPFGVCALRDGFGTLAFTDMHNNAVRFVVQTGDCVGGQKRSAAVHTMDNAGLLTPKGICASDDGRYLFVCDTGHHKVKFAALPGSSALTSAADMVAGVEMFTFAGNGKKAWRDGPVLDCSFNSPAGVWQCADGTVVVADTGNHCIRQILRTGTGNLVARTIAGGYQVASHEHIPENMNEHESRRLNKRHAGFRDGRRSLFRSPSGIVEGSYGELLVADTMNNCVRGLLPSSDGKLSWDVKTVCGIAQGGHTDGSCDVAAFSQPTSLNMGPHGTFFVSDRGNRCIRQVGGCHAQFSGSKNDCLSYSWVRTIEIGAVPRRLSQASRDIHAGCTSSSLECPLGILYLHDLRSSEPSAWTNSDRDEILAVCDGGSNVIEFIPIDSVSGEHNASSSMRQTLWDAHCPPSRAGRDAPVRSMLEECLSTKHDATTSNRPTAERRRSTRASSSQRYKSTFIPSCSMDRNPICRDILCSSDDISAFGGEDTSGNQSSEHPSQCICGNANAWKKIVAANAALQMENARLKELLHRTLKEVRSILV